MEKLTTLYCTSQCLYARYSVFCNVTNVISALCSGKIEFFILPYKSLLSANKSMHLQDPCRPAVKDAVRICTEAGVKVSHFGTV